MGVQSFHITGGEPLTRNDLREVLQYIYDKGMYGQLYTNATLIDDDFIEFLKKVRIQVVKISLDGFNPETHDQFRRAKNGYTKTLTNIKKIRDAGIPVEVGSVITKVNFKEAEKLINFIKEELKVKYHIDSFVPVGQGIDNENDIGLSDWDYISVMKNEIKEAYDLTRSMRDNKKTERETKPFFCGAGNDYVFITCRGTVKFCPSMEDKLNGGNLKEHTLSDIWLKGSIFEKYRNVNCKFIDNCPHALECKGGCRSRSISKYGGMDEPDLQSCRLFYSITKVKPPGLVYYENREKEKEDVKQNV